MKLWFVGWGVVFCIFCCDEATSQVATFPYAEHFDTIPDSALPTGWTTTTNRRASGDFFASSSSPRSSPRCLYSQNSTVAQSLTSPTFDFTNRTPDKLQFYIARSSTHTSGLLVEASLDGGTTFSIALSDTIKNPGTTSYVLNSIQLPQSVANQSSVKFRWRLTGSPAGSTATFRIDDVSLTTLVTHDLAAAVVSIQPKQPTSKDSLVCTAVVKNLGIQPALTYTVDFYCDLNQNSVFDPGEQFASVPGLTVPSGDSASMVAGHSPLTAGNYRFFAVISFPSDEQPTNDTTSTTIFVGYPRGSVLVNEIMFAPAGDEPEWIELVNGTSDSVNLKNWRISDFNTSSKSMLTASNAFLPPNGYCIVTKDTSFGLYHATVPCQVIIANFSALNNTTPDAVVIYDQRLLSIDSVYYLPTWGGQAGRSLERMDIDQPSVDSRNWGTSQDSLGSTPGWANSIVRLSFDLSFGSCWQTLSETESGVVPVINCSIHNTGKREVSGYSVQLFLDSDRDNIGQFNELITSLEISRPLLPSDSVHFAYPWLSAPQGESNILAYINVPQDQRQSNNSSLIIVHTSYDVRCVVINEIMYDPLENQNEWIELYNRGNNPVDLKNWKFSDRPTASGNRSTFTITSHASTLPPHAYAVVAADSSIFSLFPYLLNQESDMRVIVLNQSGGLSLGNDGDDILLKDLIGTMIDSVSYSPSWHRPDVTDTKGRSLERINPDLGSNAPSDWTTSVVQSGGTPGRPNSVVTVGSQATSSLSFSPNPFSPDGDGFEDFCLVQYKLPYTTALIQVKIFDIKGRLVRTLVNSQISAAEGELLWDGLNEDHQRVRIGPYIVLLQAVDSRDNGTKTLKGVVVVATKL